LIDDVVMSTRIPSAAPTPESCQLYRRLFDAIRALFAEPAAQERKYSPGTFSFNLRQRPLPACNGQTASSMSRCSFSPNVYLRCPDCNGRRYRDEVLDIRREGATAAVQHRGRAGFSR